MTGITMTKRLRLMLCLLAIALVLFAFMNHWRNEYMRLGEAEGGALYEYAAKIPDLVPQAKNSRNESSDRIPCLIHQSWKTSQLPSDRARRWRETWLHCMPDCKRVLWTDDDNRRLIGVHYQWLLPVYESLKSGVQKADLARYVYMLHYGGIYTDLDTVCLRDFRQLLKPWSLTFGGMDGHWIRSVNGSYVQNSFMASEPGHPFWLGLLHRIFIRHRKQLNGGAEESTGPLILMEELQQYIDSGLKDVRIFPPELFNPFSWITNRRKECKTHGGMSDEEETACVASFPNAFVVQMHSKSWGGGRA